MKDKFFVPFETAKALKEKGYPQASLSMILDFAAPTYHEVVDWLEGKDILIDCTCGYDYKTDEEWYRCFVIKRQRRLDDEYISNFAPTREEALNEAILKALELI